MSDVPITKAMEGLRARMASLAKDMTVEIDTQIDHLDKLKQIAVLQGELGVEDPALNETIDAFQKAAHTIKDQLSRPLPEE